MATIYKYTENWSHFTGENENSEEHIASSSSDSCRSSALVIPFPKSHFDLYISLNKGDVNPGTQ